MSTLTYQGHGSYRLQTNGGQVIYIDPYAGEGYDVPADLILVTHDHYDHNEIDKPARKPGCAVITWKEALDQGRYGTFALGDIQIETVPASNQNHDPAVCVGFVLRFDGLSLYAAGDTSETEAMHTLLPGYHLDYALLPTDGVYNMGPEEASRCVALIGARHSIPIHCKPGALFDREQALQFHADGRLIVEPGETIQLTCGK